MLLDRRNFLAVNIVGGKGHCLGSSCNGNISVMISVMQELGQPEDVEGPNRPFSASATAGRMRSR
jgi:hypothetical protein